MRLIKSTLKRNQSIKKRIKIRKSLTPKKPTHQDKTSKTTGEALLNHGSRSQSKRQVRIKFMRTLRQ
jgi:hypothetical protein